MFQHAKRSRGKVLLQSAKRGREREISHRVNHLMVSQTSGGKTLLIRLACQSVRPRSLGKRQHLLIWLVPCVLFRMSEDAECNQGHGTKNDISFTINLLLSHQKSKIKIATVHRVNDVSHGISFMIDRAFQISSLSP